MASSSARRRWIWSNSIGHSIDRLQPWSTNSNVLAIWETRTRPQINQARSLSNLPKVVLSVTEQAPYGDISTALQDELPELSTNILHLMVKGATHESPIAHREYAHVVVSALLLPELACNLMFVNGSGNLKSETRPFILDAKLANFANQVGQPSPVGSYPDGAGACGALDMIGNVWEWCLSAWGKEENDLSGYTYRSICGGAWSLSNPEHLCLADLGASAPRGQLNDTGFRCVLCFDLHEKE